MARFVPLSPELALLAACNLASDRVLADRAREAARGSIDWDRFGHLADHHGMGGLAGARLARTAPGLVPDALAGALRRVLRQQAVLQLAQTAESASLTARLGGAGIRTIVLKGMALAHTLYTPDPEWRSSLDIDILIDQADLLEADRVLRDAGYSRGWPTGDLPVAGLGMFLNLANVFEYVSPINGITVELHFRPTLNPHCLPVAFAALYATSSPIETACGTFRGLDGPLHIAYLCWHAIGHAGYRLKWFGDIARALQRASAASCADYVASGGLAFARRSAEAVDAVMAVLTSTAEGQAPGAGGVRRLGDVNRLIRGMEHRAVRPHARTFARLPGELADLLFVMKKVPGMRARGHQLLTTLTDPRDVYALGLGRPMALLYAAAGPWLSFRRFLSRSRRG